jgi:hypothetical protein
MTKIDKMIPGKEYKVPAWVWKQIPGVGHSGGIELMNVSGDYLYWIDGLDTEKKDFSGGGFADEFCNFINNTDYVVNLKTKTWHKN